MAADRSPSTAGLLEPGVVAPEEMEDLFRTIGLSRPDGKLYKEREKKYAEVSAFAGHVALLVRETRRHKELLLVDCGCGKSYLSFVLNRLLTEYLGRRCHFVCLDSDARVVQACRTAQATLGYRNMEFHVSDILDYQLPLPPDVLYSLHACDTATDKAIAKGIETHARFVLIVPCCHRELRRQLRGGHSLSDTTRFAVFKDRACALLTDGLRALALEAAGYRVEVIEFVSPTYTPKNTMIRARRVSWARNSERLAAYRRLRDGFRVRPAVEVFLPDLLG